jgi:hypothetical protein
MLAMREMEVLFVAVAIERERGKGGASKRFSLFPEKLEYLSRGRSVYKGLL